MQLRLNKETHKVGNIIVTIHRRTEACNICRIMPIRLYADKQIITRRGFRCIQHAITRTSSKSQAFDAQAFTCTRETTKNKERFCLDSSHISILTTIQFGCFVCWLYRSGKNIRMVSYFHIFYLWKITHLMFQILNITSN